MGEVTVSSIAGLRSALADPAIGTIYVAPGHYLVDSSQYLGGENGFIVGRDVTIAVVPGSTGRADFHAVMDFSKGLFLVTEGARVTFDGIGFFDTRQSYSAAASSNEAGIRFEGEYLELRNTHFRNNSNAVLGTSLSDTAALKVRASEFIDNGTTSSQEHAIYFAGESVDIEGSSFRGFGDGHAVKTVAHTATCAMCPTNRTTMSMMVARLLRQRLAPTDRLVSSTPTASAPRPPARAWITNAPNVTPRPTSTTFPIGIVGSRRCLWRLPPQSRRPPPTLQGFPRGTGPPAG